MPSKIPFDIYEAAILLCLLLVGRANKTSRSNIAKKASETLRQLATARGYKFEEDFRSSEGLIGRLRSLESIVDDKEGKGSPKTIVFSKIVGLYNDEPLEFCKILWQTMKIIDDCQLTNFGDLVNNMDDEKTFSNWLEKQYDADEKKSILNIFNTMSVLVLKMGIIKKNIKLCTQEDEFDLLIEEINNSGRKAIHSKKLLNEYIKVIRIYKEFKFSNDSINESQENLIEENLIEENDLIIDAVEYPGDKVEQILKDSDIEGCTLNEILKETTGTDRGINPLRIWLEKQSWAIEYPNQKYIHVDSFFELKESADSMLNILQKQFDVFHGYTNADIYYDAVYNNLKMFLNDNDVKNKEELFCLAKYLFEKLQYKNNHFYFYWGRHIFKDYPTFNVSDANVLKHFINDNGGMASREECLDYLERLKMSYSNLNGLLGIGNSEDIILYDESHYILVESLNINEEFKEKIRKALNLILNEFPYIVPRQLNLNYS